MMPYASYPHLWFVIGDDVLLITTGNRLEKDERPSKIMIEHR